MQVRYTCGTHTTDIPVCSAAHLVVSEDVLICSCRDANALDPRYGKANIMIMLHAYAHS